MNEIGQISHSNPTIDKKIKVFYDYFHYLLSDNEYIQLKEHPIENHISLLTKIDFRLKTSKIESSSSKIIKQLAENKLFSSKEDIISRKGKLAKAINEIKAACKQEEICIETLKSKINDAIILLNKDNDNNQKHYLNLCIENLIKYLSCNCELENHKNEIIYFTRLIVAEFIRMNYRSEELTGINSLFNKLFSKEVKIESKTDTIYTDFPLPIEIELQRNNHEEFKKTVYDFLNNRTFEQQFKGIVNYLQKDCHEAIFLVKVRNVFGAEDVKLRYGKNRVVSLSHLALNQENWQDFEKEFFQTFVNCKNCIFIEIPLNYKSLHHAIQIAYREAEDTLSYLSYPNQIFGEIDKNCILKLSNGKLGWKASNKYLNISKKLEYDINEIPDSNKSIIKIQSLDKLYFRAFTSSLNEDKLIYAWRYIEVLMKHCNITKDEKRIEELPYILLCDEKKFTKMNLKSLLINIIGNNTEVVNCKISPFDLPKVLNSKEESLNILKDNTDYYFTNKLFDLYKNEEKEFSLRYRVYKENLDLLYEQRNYVIHQAEICHISIDIFIITIQTMINRIRNSIISDIKMNNKQDLKTCVENLINKGKLLKAQEENTHSL